MPAPIRFDTAWIGPSGVLKYFHDFREADFRRAAVDGPARVLSAVVVTRAVRLPRLPNARS